MTASLVNHLWQSTLVAVLAWLVTLASLARNHGSWSAGGMGSAERELRRASGSFRQCHTNCASSFASAETKT